MVLVTIVGLFTSRIVLQALGVDDYGIYGVIGGVVGMASFLNSAMAGATSRFITFELGRGNDDRLKKIFSSALIIHILIALFVAILAETVGLWFVNNKMNFPPDRMFAVNVLYQFTILSMFVNFTQVPYSAAIIAHEKMNIYAYFEIINVTLKLLIVYLLLIINTDRLIFYAALMLAVSVLSALIYRYYCIRHFKEAKFTFTCDKAIMKEMSTYSGFDLFGNMCAIVRNQSQPIILNMFFGVVANAGSSIALTITGAIGGLTGSIASAFQPQIVKQYSTSHITDMATVMRRSVQFTLLAYSLIALPVYIVVEKILFLWLGQIPQYAPEFLRLIIITALFNIVINANNTAIHATGNIKKLSFYSGIVLLFSPVASYLILKYWISDANIVYIINIIICAIITVQGWSLIKNQIPEYPIKDYAIYVLRSWCSIGISLAIVIAINDLLVPQDDAEHLIHSLFIIFLVTVISTIVLLFLSISIALNRDETLYLRQFIIKRLKKTICRI